MNHLANGAADPLSASRGGFDADYCRTGELDDREANRVAESARDGRLAALVDANEGEIIAYLLPAGDWVAKAAEHYEQSRVTVEDIGKSLDRLARNLALVFKYLPEGERENVRTNLDAIGDAVEEIREDLTYLTPEEG